MNKFNTPKNWTILFAVLSLINLVVMVVKEWALPEYSIELIWADLSFSIWLAAFLIIKHLEKK